MPDRPAAPGVTDGTVCSRCGKALEAAEVASKEPVCSRCRLMVAGQAMVEEADRPRPRPADRRLRRLARAVAVVLLIGASWGVVAYRAGDIRDALADERPGRIGSWITDAAGDRCIAKLWLVSATLRSGGLPDPETVCPVSGRPYRVEKTGAGTSVACPDPARHGVRSITVSSTLAIPEVIE